MSFMSVERVHWRESFMNTELPSSTGPPAMKLLVLHDPLNHGHPSADSIIWSCSSVTRRCVASATVRLVHLGCVRAEALKLGLTLVPSELI